MLIDDTFQFDDAQGFIVVEGVNGAGKSTLLSSIESLLSERAAPYLVTRQPGGTSLGKELRHLLLQTESLNRSALAELFLFAADRAQHVTEVIQPALNQRKIVLSDRYSFSTEAFQGYGRQLDLQAVRQINEIAVQGCYPDLVILLDLEPEEGLRRNASTSEREKDSFESEDLAFHKRLRDGFLEMARELPIPFLVIDASLSKEEVASQARTVLKRLLRQIRGPES